MGVALVEPCTALFVHGPHVIDLVAPPCLVTRVICPGHTVALVTPPPPERSGTAS